jgi:hypothetical protein
MDKNAVLQYSRTVLDKLLLDQKLEPVPFGSTVLEVMRRHVTVACKAFSVHKAQPLRCLGDTSVPIRYSRLLHFWVQTALRRSSLLSLTADCFHRQGNEIQVTCPVVKGCPVSSVTLYCQCSSPSHLVPCFVHSDVLPPFPVGLSELSTVLESVNSQSHSPRRTLAIYLRLLMEDDGLRLSVLRINALFLWSPSSKQFFNYSRDYALFRHWSLPILPGLLKHLLLRRCESEIFTTKYEVIPR